SKIDFYTTDIPSFPTRRSSDLCKFSPGRAAPHWSNSPRRWRSRKRESRPLTTRESPADHPEQLRHIGEVGRLLLGESRREVVVADRKSTRLNSSHLVISYAVFC